MGMCSAGPTNPYSLQHTGLQHDYTPHPCHLKLNQNCAPLKVPSWDLAHIRRFGLPWAGLSMPPRSRATIASVQSAGERANGAVQRRIITNDLPPNETKGSGLLLSCSVPSGQTAAVTCVRFAKGLLALSTRMTHGLGKGAFTVCNNDVRAMATKDGEFIQAQLVVSPDAEAAFIAGISIRGTLELPHPFSGPVRARWDLHAEREVVVPIIDIPGSSTQPETGEGHPEGKCVRGHTCNGEAHPESGPSGARGRPGITQPEGLLSVTHTNSSHSLPHCAPLTLVCEWCENVVVTEKEGYIKSECSDESCNQAILHTECVLSKSQCTRPNRLLRQIVWINAATITLIEY